MTAHSEVDWLDQIRQCQEATAADEHEKIKAICGAREAGFTWEAVAGALGVSRQAAQARYQAYADGKKPVDAVKGSWK